MSLNTDQINNRKALAKALLSYEGDFLADDRFYHKSLSFFLVQFNRLEPDNILRAEKMEEYKATVFAKYGTHNLGAFAEGVLITKQLSK